ncbi:MAG: hypothetical protein Kow00109_17820 [Acidobacteriota bacterium]
MKSKWLLVVPIVLTWLAFWPVPSAFAQLGFVVGEVVDQNGNPIEGVTIRIEGMDNPRKYKLKTNKKGEFVHAGVSLQGTYRVIAEKEGYRTDYVEGIRPGFSRDDERGHVKFTLTPGQAGPLDFELTPEQKEELRRRQEEAKKRAEQLEKVRAAFEEARALFNAGQYELAVKGFEDILKIDDSQPAVWANLGACYHRMQQYDKALQAYDKAIELDPQDASYLQNKGAVYAAMGDNEKAREMFAKAAELTANQDPKEAALSYYNMGVVYINSGQTQEAEQALRKALEFDPKHAEAHYQLGLTLIGLGNIEEALEHLKIYLELSPNSENAQVAKELIQQLGG